MRVLIAPDSFKGSLSALAVAEAMAAGVASVSPTIEPDLCPLADGGEGTVEAIVAAAGGVIRQSQVLGPLGQPISASWGLIDDGQTAVIEMAAASGYHLVPESERDPSRTSSFGVGQLIRAALDAQVKKIIIGLGGSATNDGGAGMAQALGVRFEGIGDTIMTGGSLPYVQSLDFALLDPRLREVEILAACDVNNPLTGPEGASAVYGPQKGATPEQVRLLDDALVHLDGLISERIGPIQQPIGLSVTGRNLRSRPDETRMKQMSREPGAGAAGGLGYGLLAFCGGRLVSGAKLVLETVRFAERIQEASLVITGEGCFDHQTARGKTIAAVASVAGEVGVPIVVIAGAVEVEHAELSAMGIDGAFSICNRPMSLQEAINETESLITRCTASVLSSICSVAH